MAPEQRLRTKSIVLTLIQRFRRSGTISSVRKTIRKQQKAEQRLELLRAEIRHQLLLSKELEETLLQQMHRLQELSPEQQIPTEALDWLPETGPMGPRTLEALTPQQPLSLHRRA